MSKFIFVVAIFLNLSSAFSLVTNHQGFSVKILIVLFFVLIVGSVVYLFETYEK